MDRKKKFYLDDPHDVEYVLSMVNDDMAVNSEAEGDDDAEDTLTHSRSRRLEDSAEGEDEKPTRNSFSMENDQPGEREINDSEEDDNSSSENASEGETDQLEWEKMSRDPFLFQNSSFNQHYGIKNIEVDLNSPKKIFLCVMSNIFLQYIVDQSNIYAYQMGQILDLTLIELKAFIGILIIMGFHQLPSMRLYWSTDLNLGVDKIKAIMPLKRFLKILRYIHLNDNSMMPKKGDKDFDKLYKIRPFLDYTTKRFQRIFSPSQFLAIDESMVKYKGRSSLKQYMPMKPIKRGFKMWVIACAVSGYCLGMSLYEGAEATRSQISLGERVVNCLSKSFEGLSYCLFFDNFFSSVILAKNLLKKKLFSCATIRQSRKMFPKTYLKEDKNMKIGDYDGVIAGNIAINKWKDRGKKSVCVISTMHNPYKNTEVLRTQRDGSRKKMTCPKSVAEYNRFMGGVDHFDQLISTYSISWKSRRWWMRIFYYCLEACIVNSYIIYKTTLKQVSNSNRKPMSHLQYRSVLASELIGNFTARQKLGPSVLQGRGRKRNDPEGRRTIENTKRLTYVGKHLPLKSTRRRCCHCSTKNYQKRSGIICSECKVALCLECFAPFHKS